MALAACVLMFRCPPDKQDKDNGPRAHEVTFNHGRATAVAFGVGSLGGMVGQSGAFLAIPLLIHVLIMPTRLAIGSSLGITFCAALAGSFVKLFGSGPIVWPQVAVLVAASLLGSQFGSALSHRAGTTSLRYVLGVSAVRMWYHAMS